MLPHNSLPKQFLLKLVNVKTHEVKALLLAFCYYACLLCSYYVIRPIRDEMGIAGGVDMLHWLFTATFITMLLIVPAFAWITSRYTRDRFIPYCYSFFIANLLLFYFLFSLGQHEAWIARVFFVWVSVFNLFVVSVFWSFMEDIYDDETAKRLFPFIAAGGTTGAIIGPAITASLAKIIGPINLLPISAGLLTAAVLLMLTLSKLSRENITKQINESPEKQTEPGLIGGGLFDGIKLTFKSPYLFLICLLIFLYTTTSTFLYFEQAHIIEKHFIDSGARTTIFAIIDFSTNVLTLLFQLFLTSRIIKYFGLPWTLALVPLLVIAGFIALSISPIVVVIMVVQIIRRAGNYSIMRPARETLFVLLSRNEKYKAKNFIDTTIYRTGDVATAWIYSALETAGLSASSIAIIAAFVATVWAAIAYRLGIMHDTKAKQLERSSKE